MVIGVYINVSAFLIKRRGGHCSISDNNLRFSFLMYLSYFILFFNFFYKVYIAPKFNGMKELKLINSHLNGKIKENVLFKSQKHILLNDHFIQTDQKKKIF